MVSDRAITIVTLDQPVVRDATFELCYRITNSSPEDIWVCSSLGLHRYQLYAVPEKEALVIQRRLDLSPKRLMGTAPTAVYARIGSGDSRTELMSFRLPVGPRYVFVEGKAHAPMERARRIVLEIGYHTGDLPSTILDILCEAVSGRDHDPTPETHGVPEFFGGTPQGFLDMNNEGRASKREWVVIPYTWQKLKGETLLSLVVDDLDIPYREQDQRPQRPTMERSNRINLEFSGTALDFFFPYAHEQELLSLGEKEYLRALGHLEIREPRLVKTAVHEMRNGRHDAFLWVHGLAELTAYTDDQALISVQAYANSELVTPDGQIFGSEPPRQFSSLTGATPEIQGFSERVQCASNLSDLRYRLRLYASVRATPSKASSGMYDDLYPPARKWCDALASAYWRLQKGAFLAPFRCPGASGGKCHYAMNPDCRYDSLRDMVLLFETDAGWNQHGGPGLFTFENHDPRGGLVLLNDGTVMFIRTKEELHELRWR